MKKLLFVPLIIICFSIISCQKESPASTEEPLTSVEAGKQYIVPPGSIVFSSCDPWRISNFNNNGSDNTNSYGQLVFTFCPDNTVTVANDILSFNGNWYFMLDKGNPNYLTLDFNFNASTSPYWTALENNWKVIKLDKTIIELQNEDGSIKLSFEKR